MRDGWRRWSSLTIHRHALKHFPTVNNQPDSPSQSMLSRFGRNFSEAVAQRILIGILIAFSIGQVAAAIFFTPHQSMFDLAFGFGPYIHTLVEHGRLAACPEDGCSRALRMPLIPLFYGALSFVSTDQRIVAIGKVLLMSAVFLPTLAYLVRVHRCLNRHAIQCWSILGTGLFLSPPVIKHAAALDYEEGMLVELLLLWSYAYLLTILSDAKGWDARTRTLAIIVIVAATLSSLTKSSMMLALLVSVLTVSLMALRHRDAVAGVTILLCIVTIGGWGVRNRLVSGHFSMMSSWDGYNAFKGWNSASAKIYPEVNLDQIFNSTMVYLADGTLIDIELRLPHAPFANEWDSNAYLESRALQWIRSHPREALGFFARKFFVFIIGIQKTPYTYSNDARASTRPSLELCVTAVWLFFGRLLELLLLLLMWILWRTGDTTSRRLAGAASLVCVTYAAPYLAGFAYERHITVFLMLVGVSCVVLGARAWDSCESA